MKWIEYKVSTTVAAEDLVADALMEMGVAAVQINDNVPLSEADTKGMFIDILPQLPTDDGTATVSFFMDYNGDDNAKVDAGFLERIKEGLEEVRMYTDAGTLEISAAVVEDTDWLNNWKKYFKPFVVSDILIRPSWEDIPEGMEKYACLTIDPGTAFGTGSHETTQLVIEQMLKYLKKGDKVLDVGTGSGILSIAALLKGAGSAIGTDLDECAIKAAGENAMANGFGPDRFRVCLGNILDDEGVMAFAGNDNDMMVANILAPVVLELQKKAPAYVRQGGIMIFSGILDVQHDMLKEAITANPRLELLDCTRKGEWISFTARRR